jgi:hypothetical protein
MAAYGIRAVSSISTIVPQTDCGLAQDGVHFIEPRRISDGELGSDEGSLRVGRVLFGAE